MRFLNFAGLLLILFSVSVGFSADIPDSEAPQLVIKAPLNRNQDAVITVSELPETTPEKIGELLKDNRTQNSDILVTTDQASVIENVNAATSDKNDTREVRFIPIGQLASPNQSLASGFNQYYQNAKKTIMSDRIGLTVLMITTGYDSFIWIHASSMDLQQKTSMVLMNVVMAVAFGLDRDLWTRTAGALRHQIIKTFDRIAPTAKTSMTKVLSAQVVSNLILSEAVQVTRKGLLSLDHLSTAVMTTEFWTSSLEIAGLATLTSFAWSEMFGAINSQKTPVAKTMMKRIGEIRGLIMCNLASMSMVLQPEIYGHLPVVTYVVHGAIGLIVLANARKIVNWLETNNVVTKIYKKIESFESFINGVRRSKKPTTPAETEKPAPAARPVIMCKKLFAS